MASWPTYAELHAPECVVCCDPPAECPCALIIPNFTSSFPGSPDPFANLADANAAIAGWVANCIAYCYQFLAAPTGFTASNATDDELDIAITSPDGPNVFACISVVEGTTLTIVFTSSAGGPYDFLVGLHKCADYAEVGFDSVATSPGTVTISAIPAGTYFLRLIFGQLGAASFTAVVTASDTMIVNPVIAAYDDSGTTRFIDACPKTMLPGLYASKVAAQAALDAAGLVNSQALYNRGAICPARLNSVP